MRRTFLSHTRLKDLKTAYNIFTANKGSTLDYKSIRFLLRSIGVDVSPKEWLALHLEYEERGPFTWEDLVIIGEQTYNDKRIEEALLAALKELCPRSNVISTTLLKETLLSLGMGIVLSEEEVELFLSVKCDPNRTGYVAFENFVNEVLNG